MVKILFRRCRTCLGFITIVIASLLCVITLHHIYLGRGNIYLELTRSAMKNCDIPEKYTKLPENLHFNDLPHGNHNIFFVETWRGCNQMAHLTQRAACAVESAAKINPNWTVYLFFIDVIGYEKDVGHLLDTILFQQNIKIIAISLEELSRKTPLYDWVKAGHYKESQYLVSHVSDLVRILVLYKFAGTYMDTDIISLKPVDQLGKNYATAQGYFEVVPGFMNFGDDQIGREMINKIIEKFKFYWRPDEWSAQGPDLITSVMRKRCNTIFTAKMTKERCGGFRAIPTNEVLAIDFDSRHLFFEPESFKKALQVIKDSTATHLWNAFSGANNISKSTSNLINYLALQNCPSSFLSDGDSW